MVDVTTELGHLKKRLYCVGKPDAATSCPSGLEGAGRKRTLQCATRRPSTLYLAGTIVSFQIKLLFNPYSLVYLKNLPILFKLSGS